MNTTPPRSDDTPRGADSTDAPSEIDVDAILADLGVDTGFDTDPDDTPNIDAPDTATLHLDNIGGIDTAEITLHRGVTVLAGENATNRTSALRGLAAALGADDTTPASRVLSTDADHGTADLRVDDTTYTREYTRTDRGAVTVTGDPYSADASVVDAFVALLEDNPARRAVERGGDADELRDILIRPVDTAAIDQQISQLEAERRRINDRLDDIEAERDRLPDLEEQRRDLEDELEDVRDEIAAVEERVEEYDATQEEAEQAEELRDELVALRDNLGDTEEKIDYHRDQAAEYRDELDTVEDELDAVSVPEEQIDAVEEQIQQLERRKRRIEDTVHDLDTVISVNEDLVESDGALGDTGEPGATGGTAASADELTAALNPDTGTVTCWTCGTEVERSAIEDRVDTLRDLRSEKRSEISDIEDELEELRAEKRGLEAHRDERRDLEDKRDRLQQQIQHHEAEADELEAEADDLREEIADLEARVEETEELRESDLVDAYQDLSELEYERGRIAENLSDVEDEIDRIEALTDEEDELEDAADELGDALESLRGRVDDAERAAVDAFNAHMDRLIDVLGYENLARVWLERHPGDDAAEPGAFELHIVREADDGAVYEDTVETLSESEREVVGLTVALAGYMVHRVYDDVPFIVLDSVEAIDAARLSDVLEYIAARTGYLTVALLPEDATAVQEQDAGEGRRAVTQIGADALATAD